MKNTCLSTMFVTLLVACSGSGTTSSGGNSQGGSGASVGHGGGGATGTGGSASSANTGGSSTNTGGAGGAGGFVNAPECNDASDCTLVNNCCDCIGIPSDTSRPSCDVPECFAPACEALGFGDLSDAQCAAGRCVAGFDCDISKVACELLPPDCPTAMTNTHVDGCWGDCVDATECLEISSCDQCDLGTQVCVKQTTQLGPSYNCVAIPEACGDSPSCACLGASVCVAPYDTCSDTALGIDCSCPAC